MSFKLSKLIGVLYLMLLALFFFLPLLTMGRFAFQVIPVINLTWSNLTEGWAFEPMIEALLNPQVQTTAVLTAALTALTVLITLGALLPAAAFVEINQPRLKPFLNWLTLMPWVVPPVALVVGVAATFRPVFPAFLSNPLSLAFFYSIWMLPFTYRTIEGQLRMLGVSTLYEAAQASGANSVVFLFRVLLPNLRSSLIASSLLMIAAVTGEFTFAALLLKQTFPVYLIDLQSENVRAGYALSLLVIALTAGLLAGVTIWLRKKGQALTAIGV